MALWVIENSWPNKYRFEYRWETTSYADLLSGNADRIPSPGCDSPSSPVVNGVQSEHNIYKAIYTASSQWFRFDKYSVVTNEYLRAARWPLSSRWLGNPRFSYNLANNFFIGSGDVEKIKFFSIFEAYIIQILNLFINQILNERRN